MKYLHLSIAFLLLYPSLSLSQPSTNFILIPDLQFNVHQLGIERALSNRTKAGLLVAYRSDSDRPTYGDSNENVKNDFQRILFPWIYSKNGSWTDGYVLTGMVGLENSKFKSAVGSHAEVTFLDLVLLGGYQWYWDNGLNVSALAGGALLVKSNSNEDISSGETIAIVDYLHDNIKTNIHPALGIILGWSF